MGVEVSWCTITRRPFDKTKRSKFTTDLIFNHRFNGLEDDADYCSDLLLVALTHFFSIVFPTPDFIFALSLSSSQDVWVLKIRDLTGLDVAPVEWGEGCKNILNAAIQVRSA
jgi:hypothetical protein